MTAASRTGRVWSGGELQATKEILPRVFLRQCDATPDRTAVLRHVGDGWEALTFRHVRQDVDEVARGLVSIGLRVGETVLLASQTRYEWNLIDFAILRCGGVVVPAFPTLLPKTLLHQAVDSACTYAVVEDTTQLGKLLEVRDSLRSLRGIVTIERTGSEGGEQTHLSDLQARGRERADLQTQLDGRLRDVQPDDCASIVYTSGTTGPPRGVILSHWNLIAATSGALQVLPIREDSVNFAVLPLAHVYQRIVNLGALMRGAATAYSTPRTMAQDLLEVRPTIMAGVPRLYDRVYKRILEEARKRGRSTERVFNWAQAVAIRAARAKRPGERLPLGLRLRWAVADRLVYRKIRAGLGGRLEILLSGASALREDLASFFNGIGMALLEGYGLTECAAPSNANPMGRVRPGTVGPPIPGIEETLADDGEILMRGPGIFGGYHNLPSETAAAFTPDGWFRTGDFGAFDDHGYLRFLGRKKELIKLSTAKFVRPMPLEERLKECATIEDAVVIGDERAFAVALIQPQYDVLVQRLQAAGIVVSDEAVTWGTNILGERVIEGISSELLEVPQTRRLIEAEVDRVNAEFEPHEQIRRFYLVPRRFSVSSEDLTPTLKVRRDSVLRKYASEIESIYAAA